MSSEALEVVVLAGGQGTRLRSVTGSLPKALIKMNGRAFVDLKIEQLATGGAQCVHLLTGFGADQIDAHLASNPPPIPVRVHRDGDVPLGTGGALIAYRDLLPPRFVLTYGDSLLDEPLGPIWQQFLHGGHSAMMAVTHQFDSEMSGNVQVSGDLVAKYAKDPTDSTLTWLDYGYLCLSKAVLNRYPMATALDLGTISEELAVAGELAAYPVAGQFWEIGTPESLQDVISHLSDTR